MLNLPAFDRNISALLHLSSHLIASFSVLFVTNYGLLGTFIFYSQDGGDKIKSQKREAMLTQKGFGSLFF